MSQITDIKEQISDLTTFKHISSAFTEAAAVKLKNIRKAFERNDRFYDEITYIYHLVEVNAQKAKLKTIKEENKKDKKLSVALTSNQRFFGHLNNAIMESFVRFSNQNNTGRLVIGTTGDSYMRSINYKDMYQTIIFSSDIPNQEESRIFLQKILDYDQVTIFYPKFFSFLKQSVGSIEITSNIPKIKKGDRPDSKEDFNLIFEPDLSKIVKFFETQVRMILFKRVILETELARTAARLLEMSQAEERTEFQIKIKKSELRKVIRSFTNAQLLETFSGIKKWKHGIRDKRGLAQMKNKLLFFESAKELPENAN